MSLSSFFFCTQLNGFKHCYLIRIILFTIDHLFAHNEGLQELLFNTNSVQFIRLHTVKCFQVLLCNTNNSI